MSRSHCMRNAGWMAAPQAKFVLALSVCFMATMCVLRKLLLLFVTANIAHIESVYRVCDDIRGCVDIATTHAACACQSNTTQVRQRGAGGYRQRM